MSRFVPAYREGQGLENYLECAAAVSGSTRAAVLDQFAYSDHYPEDLDDAFESPTAKCLWRYVGAAPAVFAPLRDPGARGFYCPLCFVTDLRLRIFPYFRLSWSAPFTTHCALHQTPLFAWAHWHGDQRLYPKLLVEMYMGSADHMKLVKETEPFLFTVRLARRVRAWSPHEYPGAYWREHCQFETALTGSAENGCLLYGMSAGAARRVVTDLGTFLSSNFTACRSPPTGAHVASFLGPHWLFGGLGRAEPNQITKLAALTRPERKRTVLALAARIIASLRLDPTLDPDSGQLLEPGETSLTRDFTQVSIEGTRWLKSRLSVWPPFAAKLMNAVLRKSV